jgi:hypothetical protein
MRRIANRLDLDKMLENQAIPEIFRRLPWRSDKDEVTSSNLVGLICLKISWGRGISKSLFFSYPAFARENSDGAYRAEVPASEQGDAAGICSGVRRGWRRPSGNNNAFYVIVHRIRADAEFDDALFPAWGSKANRPRNDWVPDRQWATQRATGRRRRGGGARR